MNGKKFPGKTKDIYEKLWEKKQSTKKDMTPETLCNLYKKYLAYNPKLEEMLKKHNIDKEKYLQFLILFLRNIGSKET